ncbi:hypothetical protein AMTRI_Chr02g254990 [Amborella trichopoda]
MKWSQFPFGIVVVHTTDPALPNPALISALLAPYFPFTPHMVHVCRVRTFHFPYPQTLDDPSPSWSYPSFKSPQPHHFLTDHPSSFHPRYALSLSPIFYPSQTPTPLYQVPPSTFPAFFRFSKPQPPPYLRLSLLMWLPAICPLTYLLPLTIGLLCNCRAILGHLVWVPDFARSISLSFKVGLSPMLGHANPITTAANHFPPPPSPLATLPLCLTLSPSSPSPLRLAPSSHSSPFPSPSAFLLCPIHHITHPNIQSFIRRNAPPSTKKNQHYTPLSNPPTSPYSPPTKLLSPTSLYAITPLQQSRLLKNRIPLRPHHNYPPTRPPMPLPQTNLHDALTPLPPKVSSALTNFYISKGFLPPRITPPKKKNNPHTTTIDLPYNNPTTSSPTLSSSFSIHSSSPPSNVNTNPSTFTLFGIIPTWHLQSRTKDHQM